MLKISLFMILCITLSFFLISCVEEGTVQQDEVQKTSIRLSDIPASYHIEDFTNLGVWVFTIEKSFISERLKKDSNYTLTINGRDYPLKPHKVEKSLFISFLEDTIAGDEIEEGEITEKKAARLNRSEQLSLNIEKVIITGEITENGTNTYELLLEDYLQLKADKTSFVFSNGILIRPDHVKSSEENIYTLKRYYDARQMCSEKTASNALGYLKSLANHEALLFFGNSNRVTLDEAGNLTVESPDNRDRLRQIGKEGVLEGTNTFNITTDDANNRFIITLDRHVLSQNQIYNDKYWFNAQLKSTTDCEMSQINHSGLYETFIPYSEKSATEVIRNARISADLKLGLYNSSGEKTGAYNLMNEAVKNAGNGDTIKVNGAPLMNENTQSYINSKELIITSKKPYILDYTESATRAFMLDGDASLTIKNAVIQNSNISTVGAAFFVNGDSDSLTVIDSIIGTNTSTGFGGAFALYRGVTIIDNCTLTNNSNTGTGGGIYNKATCIIKNSSLSDNHANVKGGAIHNLETLSFYNNIISTNSTNMGGNGLYLSNNAIVYNSSGETWRHFNSPETAVHLIEKKLSAENIYLNNGEDEGEDILFGFSQVTNTGNLSLTPSTSTEFVNQLIAIVYETDSFFAEGSITINTPDDFTIVGNASVTTGTQEATTAAAYTYSSNSITIDGITGEAGYPITVHLQVNIPTGYVNPVQARNLNYNFEAMGDADGEGSVWTTSQKSNRPFIAYNKSVNTDFRLKSDYDYLRLITDNATEILFDEQTAAQTTVASITQALESTDPSNQTYSIHTVDRTLNPEDLLPQEATLTVTAEHGNRREFILCMESGDFKLSQTTGRYNLYKTLTEAIEAAKTGEKFTIECSATTEIKEPEIVINTGKEITIKPAANVSQITLHGNDTHRVLHITGSASITFKSTTIRKGSTLSNGGGIYFSGLTLTLEECTVENNYSGANGGGIYFGGGDLTFSNTIVQYNRSNNGGGIYIHPTTGTPVLHFDTGSVHDNDAMTDGGGICRSGGNIYTGYGCWNGPPNEMWGDYNVYFSVDTNGTCHENDLSYPAKVYNNHAQQNGQQMTM